MVKSSEDLKNRDTTRPADPEDWTLDELLNTLEELDEELSEEHASKQVGEAPDVL